MNDFFQKITKKLTKIFNTGQEQDIKLRDVTPKKIKRNTNNAMDQYIKRLHTEINKKDVYNIAISGGYGSGKTTIVTNYINENPICKNTIISLGSFFEYEVFESKTETINNKQSDNILNVDERTLVDKIEKSILKQMAYVNKEQECPDSNILRVRTFNFKDLLLYFSIIFIILSFLYYKFFIQINNYIKYIFTFNTYNSINNLIDKFIKNDKLIFILLCLSSVIFTTCIIYILVVFFRYFQTNAKSISLKINDSEVKFEDEDDLTFTKQLKEIIYIFKVNKYKVIFFEDIDRFSDDVALKVIEELKELNKIINQFMKKKVTFVYLFKDKILRTHENKGKFYDYSLSVLPISTKYNSLINLNDILNSVGIKDEIDDNLKFIASEYIIDYRSLVNLVGDYDLFRKIINTKNYNKLFAMVLFKNYYVIEYDDILSKNNMIEEKLRSIKNKRDYLIENNQKKIDLIEEEINKLLIYRNKSVSEMKKLLLFSNSNINGSIYKISEIVINDVRYNIKQFISEDFDLNLLKNSNNEKFYRTGYGDYNINYDEFEGKDEFFSQINNEEILKNKENQKKELLEANNKIAYYSISEIFQNYFSFAENITLVDELISGGYIEKDYVDYITSPPAEEGVTNEDVSFIFSVMHGEYAFNKDVNNCAYILRNLKQYLSSPYILNFNFANYLMENQNDNALLNQFNNLTEIKVDFLLEYMKKDLNGFLKFCDRLWQKGINLWNKCQKLEMNDKKKLMFAEELLNHEVNKENIDNIEKFKKIISINFSEGNNLFVKIDNIENNLKNINIKFPSISKFNEKFKNYIYRNNLYILNEENLNTLIKDNIMEISFNSIEDEKILDYIFNNINDFFRDFYMKNKLFKFDNPKIIKEKVLSKLENDDYIREIYIREDFIIKLKDIPKKFACDAIKYNHIKPTWSNINKLYNDSTEYELEKFILNNKQSLFYTKKLKDDKKKIKQSILSSIILFLNEKENYDIIDIIGKNCYSPNLRQNYIKSKEKLYTEKLIENNLLVFSDQFLKEMLKENINNINIYLDNWYQENKKEVFNSATKINNKEVFKMLLQSKKISDNDKFEKIRHMKKEQLYYMNLAFGDKEQHTINSKSKPQVFEKIKDRIEIINYNNDSYTFRMK